MISQTTEYALRAIVFIAEASRDGHQVFTAETIAKGTRVPVGYLAKVMQALAHAGLVTSQRGLHGGFTLVGSPPDLTVHQVVQAIDPIARIATCPLKIEGHGRNLCALHRGLDNVLGAVETAFKRMTIQQLIEEPEASRPCDVPPAASAEAGPAGTPAAQAAARPCPFPCRQDAPGTPVGGPDEPPESGKGRD